MKLRPIDFAIAADLASVSIPCAGALQETIAGKNNAYCILGLIVVAHARRTKKSIKKALGVPFETIQRDVDEAAGVVRFGKSHDMEVWELNDRIAPEASEYGSDRYDKAVIRARNWQVKTLEKLFHKAYDREML